MKLLNDIFFLISINSVCFAGFETFPNRLAEFGAYMENFSTITGSLAKLECLDDEPKKRFSQLTRSISISPLEIEKKYNSLLGELSNSIDGKGTCNTTFEKIALEANLRKIATERFLEELIQIKLDMRRNIGRIYGAGVSVNLVNGNQNCGDVSFNLMELVGGLNHDFAAQFNPLITNIEATVKFWKEYETKNQMLAKSCGQEKGSESDSLSIVAIKEHEHVIGLTSSRSNISSSPNVLSVKYEKPNRVSSKDSRLFKQALFPKGETGSTKSIQETQSSKIPITGIAKAYSTIASNQEAGISNNGLKSGLINLENKTRGSEALAISKESIYAEQKMNKLLQGNVDLGIPIDLNRNRKQIDKDTKMLNRGQFDFGLFSQSATNTLNVDGASLFERTNYYLRIVFEPKLKILP